MLLQPAPMRKWDIGSLKETSPPSGDGTAVTVAPVTRVERGRVSVGKAVMAYPPSVAGGGPVPGLPSKTSAACALPATPRASSVVTPATIARRGTRGASMVDPFGPRPPAGGEHRWSSDRTPIKGA